MSRNLLDKPHHTPDPETPPTGARGDLSGVPQSTQGVSGPAEQPANERSDPEPEEPSYDSCFDDLNVVLSQSMEEPDPDPNLGTAGERPRPVEGTDLEIGRSPARRGRAPRTSEIFRSVVAAGVDPPRSSGSSSPPAVQDQAAVETEMPDLGFLDRRTGSADSTDEVDRYHEGSIPWGQITLLTYASVLTLGLIWLLWTGRIPKAAAPESPAADKPAVEPVLQPAPPQSDTPAPPLPPENIASLGQTIRLGDLEVKPLSVEARPVELIRTIDLRARRREAECLVLRLRLLNLSKDQTFSPVDQNLVRERDLRSFDPYIASSGGPSIRLFPLAMDSEWSILGQGFPRLAPGESGETFVAAEPGSANQLGDEMIWRVRLRIGVYRSDMLGVKFTKAQVRRQSARSWEDEE